MLNLLKKNFYSLHLCEAFKYVMEREKKNLSNNYFLAHMKRKKKGRLKNEANKSWLKRLFYASKSYYTETCLNK